jgi:hypothetical protein
MTQRKYVDLDLLIEGADGGTYRTQVPNSPVGELAPVPVPFTDLELERELENFDLRVGWPSRSATAARTPEVY